MNITVKCPNCYQQVSKENKYCIFCGYDLSGVSASSPPEVSTPSTAETTVERTVVYEGPCYCPKGHNVPDPSLGFCSVCGAPLVNEPSECSAPIEDFVSETPSPSGHKYSCRKCKCGYLCDDPDLSFCPSCGLPLESSGTIDDPGWVCSCGERNPSDMGFCVSCGKPKGWRPPEHKSEPMEPQEEILIPFGMKTPKDDDLDVKSKYGN